MKENLEALATKPNTRIETLIEAEPTAEILGNIMELSATKRWFNEGPRRLDIG